MPLDLRLSDPGLFLKAISESGLTFYTPIENNIVVAVYYSSNRQIYFRGLMTPVQYNSLKSLAYPVTSIEIDEFNHTVRISQLSED